MVKLYVVVPPEIGTTDEKTVVSGDPIPQLAPAAPQ